ncbi:MAG: hypothetical protein KF830_01665 [Planctomycetes bacterium]|nr:hypothetical protein [Planctomycetota bacterium]
MTDGRPQLAVSGSNVTGDVPFSCALRLPHGVVEARSPAGQRGDLAGLVAGLCAAHGVRPEDLGGLRIDLGPGSYTGLRVAVTFVRFLQRFGALPVLAADSLSLLATAAIGRVPRATRLRPLLDARRGRWHTATLHCDAALRLAEPPRAVPWPEVVADVRGGDLFVVPASAEAEVGAELRSRGGAVLAAAGISARQLFRAELDLAAADAAALEPHYLMGSYAEPD